MVANKIIQDTKKKTPHSLLCPWILPLFYHIFQVTNHQNHILSIFAILWLGMSIPSGKAWQGDDIFLQRKSSPTPSHTKTCKTVRNLLAGDQSQYPSQKHFVICTQPEQPHFCPQHLQTAHCLLPWSWPCYSTNHDPAHSWDYSALRGHLQNTFPALLSTLFWWLSEFLLQKLLEWPYIID